MLHFYMINPPYIKYLKENLPTNQLASCLDQVSSAEAYHLIRYLYLVTIQRALADNSTQEQQALIRALVKSDQDFCDWIKAHPKTAAAIIEACQRVVIACNNL